METKLFSHHAISRRDLGLQKRPTYEDLVNYIVKDPDNIKYPDRKAKILRNSFELSQLDGIGMMEINRQHELQIINQERQLMLQRFADDYGLPLGEVMAYIDHHGLHPVREGEAPPAILDAPAPPAQGNVYNIHDHRHYLQDINGVPANPAPAPAGQPAPAPQPPPMVSTGVQVTLMNMGVLPTQPSFSPSHQHRDTV